MKRIMISVVVAAVWLTVFTARDARADAPLKISLSGTVYIQGENSEVGDIQTARIDKVRVNTKDLLILFMDLLNQPFPIGSYIEMSPDGMMTVKFKDQALADVSPYFSITVDDQFEGLYKGKFNNLTFQESSTFMYSILVRIGNDDGILNPIDDSNPDVDLYLGGVATETYKATAERDSQQRVSSIASATVAGGGRVGGNPALFKGQVSAKGKAFVDVDH
jgi:hypothetical protein